MLRPVVALGQAAHRLAEGDSDFPLVDTGSEDEIGIATRSFLTMREAQKIFVRFSNPALVREIVAGRAPDHPEEVKLTIGFGDGVRFTDWSSAHTAAEISTRLTDFFTLFGQLVASTDGIVEKFIGDAVMSYYGLHAEIGTEESARNAIRSHLCAQIVFNLANRAFHRFHRRLPLRFRFGIATGKCVVGPMGARGVKLDYTLIGSTVNLASRLEGVAEPGGLVIDNFTYQNAGGPDFLVVHGPETQPIKGFSQPVQFYRVMSLRQPEEIERRKAFLTEFFKRELVRDVLRLTPIQHQEFEAEVQQRMEVPGLVLPTEPV